MRYPEDQQAALPADRAQRFERRSSAFCEGFISLCKASDPFFFCSSTVEHRFGREKGEEGEGGQATHPSPTACKAPSSDDEGQGRWAAGLS